MSRRLVAARSASPDGDAALDGFIMASGTSPYDPNLLATPAYEALMSEDEDETLSTRVAFEALTGAHCPKNNVPSQLLGTNSALTSDSATNAKETLARQALYASEDRVYPRTSPHVSSFGVFEIPPSTSTIGGGASYDSPRGGSDPSLPLFAHPSSPTYATNNNNTSTNPSFPMTQRGGRQYNSLDEGQRLQSCQLWWQDSGDRAEAQAQCPRMPIPPEVVAIPPLGFPKPFSDSAYRWNSRYLSVLYVGDSEERNAAAALFVKEFADEAVPMLNFVLSNLTSLPSSILHCRGITVEVLGKAPHIEALFEGDHNLAYKVTGREYSARLAAQKEKVPQLVIPYTIMVELYGAKAIAYPRTPLNPRSLAGPSSGDGLAYGVRTDLRLFHNEFSFLSTDVEAESVARRLAKSLGAKAKYLGREYSSLTCLYSPSTFAIYRSPHDNRLYTGMLQHMFTPTISTDTAACNTYYVHTFRPEFAEKHQTEPLSFESCTHLQVVGREEDEAARVDNVQLLKRYVIPQAAQQFSRDVRLWGVGWPLLERGGLARFMHHSGINMRYLVEFRNGIRAGPKHNSARAFVEIEMVGRALKRAILQQCAQYMKNGIAYPHEISNHLKNYATNSAASLWEGSVWPAIVDRYPAVANEKWTPTRLDWRKCVERLLTLLGAQVRTSRASPQGPPTSRVVYTPMVSVPPFPPAPYGDGETLQLTLKARRYLRSVVAGTVTETAKQQALLCVQLLQNGPEEGCEELLSYIAAEARRKEKLRAANGQRAGDGERRMAVRPAAAQGLALGTYSHFVSMRDREGRLIFDPSPEAMTSFGFLTQQRLQITLGPNKGRRTQVIGARGGHMWRADAGSDQPVECAGKTHMELMINYGFVVLDHDEHSYVEDPLVLPGDGTLLIFEQSRAVAEGLYGYAVGQRVLLRAPGPYQGHVTTIVGVRDGALHHFPAGTVGYPVPFPPGSGQATSALVLGAVSLASYPTDATALDSYLGSPIGDFYIGFKVTTPFGYHYRQVVRFAKGPYQGHTACVLGAGRGLLWGVLDYGETFALGDVKLSINDTHAPSVIGILSEEWARSQFSTNSVFYPTLGGEPVALSTADVDVLEAADLMPGVKVMITGGYRCGEVAAVVGARYNKVWVQYEGETGGVPLTTESYVIIKDDAEMGAEGHSSAMSKTLELNKVTAGEGSSSIAALSPCGSIIPLSIDPLSTLVFGFCHGQHLVVPRYYDHEQRYLARAAREAIARARVGGGDEGETALRLDDETLFPPTISPSDFYSPLDTTTAPKARRGVDSSLCASVVVIGAYRHQLWVQREGCAYVWPLKGYNAWELRNSHGDISIASAASAVPPWSDGFLRVDDLLHISWTSFDRQYRVDGTVTFALQSGDVIGLTVSEAATAPFVPKMVLRQRISSNFKEDAVVKSISLSSSTTPFIQVVGGWGGITYVTDYFLTEEVTTVDPKAIVRPLLDGHLFEEVTTAELEALWRQMDARYGELSSDACAGKQANGGVKQPRAVEPFLKQIGVLSPPPRGASAGECFALVDGNGILFQAVPREVVAKATNFESPETLVYTDQGAYNFETMTYRQYIVDFGLIDLTRPRPSVAQLRRVSTLRKRSTSNAALPMRKRTDSYNQVVGNNTNAISRDITDVEEGNHSHTVREEIFKIVRRKVYTPESVLVGDFGVLPSWGSSLLETIEDLAASLTPQLGDANRINAAKMLGLTTSRAYFDEDLAHWRETVAECISELLTLDLIAEGAGIPDSTVREFIGTHQFFPPKGLHGCCAYVLALVGCDERVLLHHYTLDECVRMLLALVSRANGTPLGVTLTMEEYMNHLARSLRVTEREERSERTAINKAQEASLASVVADPRFTSFSLGSMSAFSGVGIGFELKPTVTYSDDEAHDLSGEDEGGVRGGENGIEHWLADETDLTPQPLGYGTAKQGGNKGEKRRRPTLSIATTSSTMQGSHRAGPESVNGDDNNEDDYTSESGDGVSCAGMRGSKKREPWRRFARVRAEIIALYPAAQDSLPATVANASRPSPDLTITDGGGGGGGRSKSVLSRVSANTSSAVRPAGGSRLDNAKPTTGFSRGEGGLNSLLSLPSHQALRILKEGFRFTLDDGSVMHLMSFSEAFPRFERGDVVRYTVGDLRGQLATILGVRHGELWRCEHSGPYAGRGLPFEGNALDIDRRFGPEVVPPSMSPASAGPIGPSLGTHQGNDSLGEGFLLKQADTEGSSSSSSAPMLICGNSSSFLSWTGEIVDFDVSHESCFLKYGVVVGQRFQATQQTPFYYPYREFVIVIVGVYKDRLWFACDGTGAMPFPQELSNPIYSFRLRLLYSAPIHPPPLAADQYVRTQGSMSEVERRFFHDPSGQTMVFEVSKRSLFSFRQLGSGGGLVLSHGLKVVAVEPSTGKSRRATIVGVRHAKLWALIEYDSYATALPADTVYQSVPAEETQTARVPCFPFPFPPPTPITTRRFPLPQGGLGVFSTEGVAISHGVESGDCISWGSGQRRVNSVVLGIRNGALWRNDEGETIARPFQGRPSLLSAKELCVERTGADLRSVRPRPW